VGSIMVLEYADRVFKQKDRLSKQLERIEAQNKRKIKWEHKMENKRMNLQENRISQQQTTSYRRTEEARVRGQKITGIDNTERKKLSKERGWRGKWSLRKAKFNRRVMKSKIR